MQTTSGICRCIHHREMNMQTSSHRSAADHPGLFAGTNAAASPAAPVRCIRWLQRNLNVFLVIPFVIAFLSIKIRCPDSDFWFIAAAGRYITEEGVIPTVNPFVIHDNYGIIVQQWLFDVILYLLYRAAGNAGLYLYCALAFLLANILLYRYLLLFTDNHRFIAVVLAVWCLMQCQTAVTRPTSVTFLILTAELILLEQYRQGRSRRILFLLPALSVLEVNLHASLWPFLFIMALPYLVPDQIRGELRDMLRSFLRTNRSLLLSLTAAFAAGFLNPYGLRGMFYLALSYPSASKYDAIDEMKAPALFSIYGIVILAAFCILIIYIIRFRGRLSLTRICMAAGTILLAAMHTRSFWFPILGAGPLLALIMNDRAAHERECGHSPETGAAAGAREKAAPAGKRETTAPAGSTKTAASAESRMTISFPEVILYAALSMLLALVCPIPYKVSDSVTLPSAAADYLDSLNNPGEIVLYTGFNNGGYMEWRGYKVYMDARPELFSAAVNGREDTYEEYLSVRDGSADYESFCAQYGFTYLIADENTRFDVYLRTCGDYEIAVIGDGYTLYHLIAD